jgi:hypothetical protein
LLKIFSSSIIVAAGMGPADVSSIMNVSCIVGVGTTALAAAVALRLPTADERRRGSHDNQLARNSKGRSRGSLRASAPAIPGGRGIAASRQMRSGDISHACVSHLVFSCLDSAQT